jgi:hypothetical protein
MKKQSTDDSGDDESESDEANPNGDANANGKNNKKKSNKKNKKRDRVPGGGESAAAASNTSASPLNFVVGPYARCVLRNEMLYCRNVKQGTAHLYTATVDKCLLCEKKNPSERHSSPRCFICKCNVCGLWGHKAEDCRQDVGSKNGKAHAAVETDDTA